MPAPRVAAHRERWSTRRPAVSTYWRSRTQPSTNFPTIPPVGLHLLAHNWAASTASPMIPSNTGAFTGNRGGCPARTTHRDETAVLDGPRSREGRQQPVGHRTADPRPNSGCYSTATAFERRPATASRLAAPRSIVVRHKCCAVVAWSARWASLVGRCRSWTADSNIAVCQPCSVKV